MEFREFLSQWIAGTGWSLTRFADEVGVSQSLVSKWLHANPRRRVRPSAETIRRLAVVLSVPEVDLLRMLGYFSESDLTVADPELAAITAAWPRLSDGVREAIKILAGSVGALTMVQPGTNFAPA